MWQLVRAAFHGHLIKTTSGFLQVFGFQVFPARESAVPAASARLSYGYTMGGDLGAVWENVQFYDSGWLCNFMISFPSGLVCKTMGLRAFFYVSYARSTGLRGGLWRLLEGLHKNQVQAPHTSINKGFQSPDDTYETIWKRDRIA